MEVESCKQVTYLWENGNGMRSLTVQGQMRITDIFKPQWQAEEVRARAWVEGADWQVLRTEARWVIECPLCSDDSCHACGVWSYWMQDLAGQKYRVQSDFISSFTVKKSKHILQVDCILCGSLFRSLCKPLCNQLLLCPPCRLSAGATVWLFISEIFLLI